MIVKPIDDPWLVWKHIEADLQDQDENLIIAGTFMGVFDDDHLAGAFLIKHRSNYCLEIHGGVHPDYFGQGREICQTLGLILFKKTPCLKIVAFVPEFNTLMRNTLIRMGMKHEGTLKNSFLKGMKLYNEYIYGICKSEVR